METKGKISYKTPTGKAIKLEGSNDFYNAYKAEDIAQYQVGQTVAITYEINKTYRNIKSIELIADAQPEPKKDEKTAQKPPEEKKEPEPVYLCKDCGAKLKDNKYPTCYDCNKKKGFKGGFKGKGNNFNSPERDAQIRRGNALNSAGAALSGNMTGADPEALKQALLYIAEGALNWLEEKNK
jgi:hypothetical protein